MHYGYDAAGNRITKKLSATEEDYYVRDAQGNVLGIYSYDNTNFTWAEQHLYGSSRLGMVTPGLTIQSSTPLANADYNATGDPVTNGTEGKRIYELTNHLGNVMVTISDKKTGVDEDSDTVIDYYEAEVLTAQDYYAFGMMMPGRTYANAGAKYKYGFNGKENDNEVKGEGNQQDYGMRIYDPRLGRFWSVDPLTRSYPELSPYQYASNSPIENSDLDGKESISETQHGLARKFEAQIQMKNAQQNAYEQKIRHFTNPSNSPQVPPPPYLKPSPNFSPTEKTNLQVLFNINLQNEGYNYDLTKKPGTKLLDNKTYQNFSNNIALPTLEIASYISGLGEASALLKLSKPVANVAAKTSTNVLSKGELLRIENAATRINKPITVVGSRASGTAKAYSDWDYVIPGLTNKNWKTIKNSLPGSKSVMDNMPRNIDLHQPPVRIHEPHIIINPR